MTSKDRDADPLQRGEEYPESDLSHLLVNKQYFQESCRVWLRSKTFSFEYSREMEAFASSKDPIQRFMLAYVSSIDLSDQPWHIDGMVTLPLLRSFSVELHDLTMKNALGGKTPWLDDYSDVELADMGIIQNLLDLRGLHSVKINWRENHFQLKEPQHLVKWAAFKIQVESLVRDVVTQPREMTWSVRANLTLDEALRAKKDTTIDKALASEATFPSAKLSPISDEDIPSTENQALRLFLSRPAALFRWMRDAADKSMRHKS